MSEAREAAQLADAGASGDEHDAPSWRVRAETADIAIGLVLLATAIGFFVATRTLDGPDNTGVGPATFPVGISILFGICSALLIGRAVMSRMGPETRPPVIIGRPVQLIVSIGLVCAFPVMMDRLGYYIATALWLPAFLWAAGYRKPIGILLYTGGFLAFAKLAFEVTLGVRLP